MAWRSIALLLIALLLSVLGAARAAAGDSDAVATVGAVASVELEVAVTDAQGRPVVDLDQMELDIVQEGKRQVVKGFARTGVPGHYAIHYVPDSGRAGSVAVWVRRKGTRVRGPRGGDLEPRVVRGLSGLEAALVRILEQGADGDLACPTAVLRFDWGAQGQRHVLAAEVPLANLRLEGTHVRDQVLARIKGPQGPARHLTLDRTVAVESPMQVLGERLIWTSSVSLEPGRHDVDMLVHDPNAGRHSRRSFVLEVPAVHEGIQMSSVTALQGRAAFVEGDAEADAALVYEGAALMPKLDPAYERGADARLLLFATLYPDARSAAPVSLRAELRLDGQKVADLPTVLPKPEPNGEIRWAANMTTSRLPLGHWQLVLVAQQGLSSVSDRTSFEIVERLDTPAMRLGL